MANSEFVSLVTAQRFLAATRDEVKVAEQRLAAARAEAAKAALSYGRADPDHPAFEDVVRSRALAEGRVQALEAQLEAMKKRVSAVTVQTQAQEVAAKQAELKATVARARAIDRALFDHVVKARASAREQLKNLENELNDAMKLELEIAALCRVTIPSYEVPRHYGTACSMVTHSHSRIILQKLEEQVDDPTNGVSRGFFQA